MHDEWKLHLHIPVRDTFHSFMDTRAILSETFNLLTIILLLTNNLLMTKILLLKERTFVFSWNRCDLLLFIMKSNPKTITKHSLSYLQISNLEPYNIPKYFWTVGTRGTNCNCTAIPRISSSTRMVRRICEKKIEANLISNKNSFACEFTYCWLCWLAVVVIRYHFCLLDVSERKAMLLCKNDILP